jgi:hypothetical protein
MVVVAIAGTDHGTRGARVPAALLVLALLCDGAGASRADCGGLVRGAEY